MIYIGRCRNDKTNKTRFEGPYLADDRCSPAVVDSLRSTHVGSTAPLVEENWGSKGSEADPEDAREKGTGEMEVGEVEEQARGLLVTFGAL